MLRVKRNGKERLIIQLVDSKDQQAASARPSAGKNNYSAADDKASERLPEWMDYNPNFEPEQQDPLAAQQEMDMKAEFANDLEAWKTSMKQRDMLSAESSTVKKDNFGPSPPYAQKKAPLKGKLERRREKMCSQYDRWIGG